MKLYLRVYKEKQEPAVKKDGETGTPLAEGIRRTRYIGRMRVCGETKGPERQVSAKSPGELAGKIGDKLAEIEPSVRESRIPEIAVRFAYKPAEKSGREAADGKEKAANGKNRAEDGKKIEKRIFSGDEITDFISAIERALMPAPPLGA